MLSLEQLLQMVKEHLGLYDPTDGVLHSSKWVIAESPLGGRGLFATEDIMTGEVLFVDHTLIKGPRSGTTIQQGCTVCSKLDCDVLFKCPKCALLLCSKECQISSVHHDDCATVARWSNKAPIEDIDETIMSRALTAIRALLLNDNQKQLMGSLVAHTFERHENDIRDLMNYFDIPENEENIMRLACLVLDANAFQIPNLCGNKDMSLRGLYPVAALMNHSCVPNTRHGFNAEQQMTVKAVKPIQAGAEILTCYTGLLWGTPARRTHLYKTKHFLCACDRCADPTERGTLLAALKCFSNECPGSLLPIEPLKSSTSWRCLECGLRVPNTNIGTIQAALGSLMNTLDFENIDALERFLMQRITKYIPKTNQIVVDLQCRLIWEFGEADGLCWNELSESRLALKESLCRGTLRTLAALGAGDARLRGLLLYHLHAALAERARRHPYLYEHLKSEIETTIKQAYNILHGCTSSPPDLELRYRYLGPGCDKPQEERFFILDN